MRISDWSSDVCSSDLFRQYFQIVERARNHSGNDDIVYVLHCETFEHQQLVKPHGIFVGCPPGVCGNPPARANLTAFHQGKNDVGVSCVYGKQHDLFLRSRSEEHTSELQSLMRISY